MQDTSQTSPEDLDPFARSTLKVLFVTLFLDLVGFSIIFPLFPSMLSYYMEKEGTEGLVGLVVSALERFASTAGGPENIGIVVLFGGVLGSLYALLQFVFTPIFGRLSDRIGRRPVLLISISGIVLSYVLWIVAGRFFVLILARVLGGIMSANISTASAAVADITSSRNRSKGMAVIGMAFGLGFVVGPVIGGFSAAFDPTAMWPGLAAYGVNPFSTPAFIALILAVINLVYVAVCFTETFDTDQRKSGRINRSFNPARLFRTDIYVGVTRTNMTNFFFITAFSGMEFSLTFLAMDRLGYGPRQNAYMFLFVGTLLALVQGGYVRRRAPVIGPKRMSIQGLIMTIPGMVLIGAAQNSVVLYCGLFLMAVGSAQVLPCFTALVSMYAPPNEQGRVLGVFRSLGALARGIGPLLACLMYWRIGASWAYFLGAAALLIPLVLASGFPAVRDEEPAPARGLPATPP